LEAKKGRMSRVYTGDKKPASPEKVKKGGSDKDTMKGKSPKTPRMGG
jgi:hypothetical protein